MFWFESDTYKTQHADLLANINDMPASQMAELKWTDSSYNNDATGSVMFELTNDGENYVQLFAFETTEDAIRELGDEGKQYGISVCHNGETTYDGWEGNDREEAMVQAIIEAEKLLVLHIPHADHTL
jgi:hypothetical protein|tara:strand:+ start:136 stop:516 length:381 start_codon:yes stop_codon:yes gene_type:complete